MNTSKLLIIEDNTDIRENIAELLSLCGYQTYAAKNGKQGIKMALEHLPDLILCDIMMPGLDGHGVLHILGQHRETLHIPFIFLTAKAEQSDFRRGMSLGADDYITKPFEETVLLQAIENRLKKSSNTNKPLKGITFEDLFLHKKVKSFSSKQFIYQEGDTTSFVHFVRSGKVKITNMNKEGKEMVLELCKNDDFFGYWGALEEQRHGEAAEAMEDCVIWQIPIADFRRLLSASAEVSGKFLKLLSKNIRLKEKKILELAYESVRKRVANSLLALHDVYANEQNRGINVPRDLIATMAGTSVETAIRMLTEFKNAGYVRVNASEITILEYEKLKNAPF